MLQGYVVQGVMCTCATRYIVCTIASDFTKGILLLKGFNKIGNKGLKLFELNTTYTAYSTHYPPPHFFKSLGHAILGTKTNLNIILKHRVSSLPSYFSWTCRKSILFWITALCTLISKYFSWHQTDMVREMSLKANHAFDFQI